MMKAYLVQTTQEVIDYCLLDLMDHYVGNVHLIYIPNRFVLGYDSTKDRNRIVFSHKLPFLDVPEIVDGKKSGNVREIKLDERTVDRIMSIIPHLDWENNGGERDSQFYNEIKEIINEQESKLLEKSRI